MSKSGGRTGRGAASALPVLPVPVLAVPTLTVRKAECAKRDESGIAWVEPPAPDHCTGGSPVKPAKE